ncbi:MAG: HlyD family efflux transporter periplasmic adaptor subunit [Chitinophagaceae bacterium]|nr:HlyD family efflux transporter periplasmic adaptor subunit [Chitinophagaceae bacterium]
MSVEERLRNEEARIVLTKEPSKLTRWGMSIMFFVFLALFLISLLVNYSDIIKAEIVLTKENEPIKIVAKNNGSIDLLVHENQLVKANDYLAIIQNTADSADIFFLRNLLLYAEQGNYLMSYLLNRPELTTNKKLGDLQAPYLILYKAIDDYKLYKRLNYYQNKIVSKQQQISQYQKMFAKTKEKTSLMNKELSLIKKDYEIDRSLFKNNTIAEQELRNSEKVFLQKQSSLVTNQQDELNMLSRIEELKESIIDLSMQNLQEENKYKISVDQAYEQLKNDFANWEKEYVLRTPVEGKVSFFRFINNKQFIKANEDIIGIIPKDADSTIIGKVNISVSGAGKVKEGETVNIKLDGYPYQEYGILYGEVTSISLIPNDKQYAVKVKLTNGLTTSYKKQIPFAQQLHGQADIVTKKLSLAERIFYQIVSVFKNQ